MTSPGRPRPVAVSDIAAMLGVSVHTVNQWKRRSIEGMQRAEPFPPASGKIANTDFWWEDEIIAWAERTGRLKP